MTAMEGLEADLSKRDREWKLETALRLGFGRSKIVAILCRFEVTPLRNPYDIHEVFVHLNTRFDRQLVALVRSFQPIHYWSRCHLVHRLHLDHHAHADRG